MRSLGEKTSCKRDRSVFRILEHSMGKRTERARRKDWKKEKFHWKVLRNSRKFRTQVWANGPQGRKRFQVEYK